MKDKNFYFVLLMLIFFSASVSFAQITIGSSDLPSAGDTFVVSIGQAFPGMDPALTDSNYTWNYSQLTSASQTTDTFVSILSTGLFGLAFFNSSYALKSNTAPVSLLGVLTISYEFDFFKKSSSAFVQTGFGATMNGFPLPVPFAPKDTIYRFPLHFNNTGSSSSAFSVTIPSLGFYGGNKTRTDTVDGWGTLTTPYGSFPVLRVKSVINETDSIYVDTLLNIGFSIPRLPVTEYKWLGANQGIPLLQINTTAGFVTRIIYRDSLRTQPQSVNDPGQSNGDGINFSVFPNPSTGKFLLNFNLEKPEEVSVEVSDLNGKSVFFNSGGKKQPGADFLWIDLSGKNLASGMYLLKLTAGKKSSTTKILLGKE